MVIKWMKSKHLMEGFLRYIILRLNCSINGLHHYISYSLVKVGSFEWRLLLLIYDFWFCIIPVFVLTWLLSDDMKIFLLVWKRIQVNNHTFIIAGFFNQWEMEDDCLHFTLRVGLLVSLIWLALLLCLGFFLWKKTGCHGKKKYRWRRSRSRFKRLMRKVYNWGQCYFISVNYGIFQFGTIWDFDVWKTYTSLVCPRQGLLANAQFFLKVT